MSSIHLDDHASIRDSLPEYALGILSLEEATSVAAHLRTCPECRTIVWEYSEVLHLLPQGLPAAEPSPATRRAILAQVREDRDRERRTPAQGSYWWKMAAAGIAACLLVASIAIAVMRLGSSDAIPSDDPAALLAELHHRPGAQMLVMVGSPNAPSAVGQIMLDPGDTRAAMLVSGLPPLRVDQAYQLWFVQPDETRISGAVFSVDSNGAAIVAVNAPPDFSRDWRCGVTEEPAGGSAAPTGRNVLIARYAADPETRQTYDEMP